ncbi:hypothetical protein BKA62DRAFT_713240, partial [Auriculariales sp. MPI-PUGE-AT-0066]
LGPPAASSSNAKSSCAPLRGTMFAERVPVRRAHALQVRGNVWASAWGRSCGSSLPSREMMSSVFGLSPDAAEPGDWPGGEVLDGEPAEGGEVPSRWRRPLRECWASALSLRLCSAMRNAPRRSAIRLTTVNRWNIGSLGGGHAFRDRSSRRPTWGNIVSSNDYQRRPAERSPGLYVIALAAVPVFEVDLEERCDRRWRVIRIG